MAARRTVAGTKAFERDGEVLQAEVLPHEADLEVLGVHADVGGQVRNVGDADDAVVAHLAAPSLGNVAADYTTDRAATSPQLGT
jgi:hypothetical protein